MAFQTPQGDSRLIESGRVLDALVAAAVDYHPDLVVFAGDTFDTRRPGPGELALFAETIKRLRKVSPVVIGTGNHDGTGTIADPGSHTLRWIAALDLPGVTVITEPRIVDVAGIAVVGMPYAHKRAFDTLLSALSPEDRVLEAGKRLQNLIEMQLREAKSRDNPVLFVGHLSVAGSRVGSERLMHFGWDVTVGAEAFGDADYAALGHIHRQQMLGDTLGGSYPFLTTAPNMTLRRVGYPGSPVAVTFDEADEERCFLLVDFATKAPSFMRLKSPATPLLRTTLAVDADGSVPGLQAAFQGMEEGTLVSVVLTGTGRIPASTEAEVRRVLAAAGAARVRISAQVERPIVEQAASGPQDETDEEATSRWLTNHGYEVEPYLEVAREFLARSAA